MAGVPSLQTALRAVASETVSFINTELTPPVSEEPDGGFASSWTSELGEVGGAVVVVVAVVVDVSEDGVLTAALLCVDTVAAFVAVFCVFGCAKKTTPAITASTTTAAMTATITPDDPVGTDGGVNEGGVGVEEAGVGDELGVSI